MLHTFHTVVSSSQGFTIGTSPWDESCKNRRKAAATALNRPAVQSYMPLIDLESTVSIKELVHDSKGGQIDLDPRAYWQRYALNTSLTLNYGYRIDGDKDAPLLKEIVEVERGVGNFRSTSNNWQDYVPLLRLFPSQSNEAVRFRERRDVYMDRLLNTLQAKIENGTDKPCITGNIIKDPDAKLSRGTPTPPPPLLSPTSSFVRELNTPTPQQLSSNQSASPWSPRASTPCPATSSWGLHTCPRPRAS
jgi:phenylacetate 2-hydroxylase